MTPEESRQLREIHAAILRLADRQTELHEKTRKLERRVSTVISWVRVLISERGTKDPNSIRPPLPSLSGDDSGSFSAQAGPLRIAAHGGFAMRAALVVIGIAVLIASVAYAARGASRGAQTTSATHTP